MKQALEVMGLIVADSICEAAHHQKKNRHEFGEPCPIQQRWHKAFDTLRAAIEQAEKQGPCIAVSNGKITIDARNGNLSIGAPRQWVGLTDEEIMETVGQITNYRGEYEVAVGHAIEAKLREKNDVLRSV